MFSGLKIYLKCFCGWGSVPDPAGGVHSTPQTPSWTKGLTSKGEGREERGCEGRKGRGSEGGGREER